jgi:ribosomal protein L37AE/L43A
MPNIEKNQEHFRRLAKIHMSQKLHQDKTYYTHECKFCGHRVRARSDSNSIAKCMICNRYEWKKI